jgi:arylsulfatase A-like enzyme
MRAIVLVIDGLHRGYLGCYGNSWVGTPAWDAFAAEGAVCDQFLIESSHLAHVYSALWTAQHPLVASDGTWLAELATQGVPAWLLSDDEQVAGHALAGTFDDVVRMPPVQPGQLADQWEETRLGHFFATAAEMCVEAPAQSLLWLHTTALGQHWDAPYEYRARYVARDDPPPPEIVVAPNLELPEDFDPDLLWGYRCAYAGQVALLDECLAGWLDVCREHPEHSETLMIVVSSRGFPLGEHRQVGLESAPLHSELIHTAAVIRAPGDPMAIRLPQFVQGCDLGETLRRWFKLPAQPVQSGRGAPLQPLLESATVPWRDRVLITNEQERGLRVPSWYWRESHSASIETSSPTSTLFAKPDDRWEANPLERRCPEIVMELRERADELQAALTRHRTEPLTPLSSDCTSEHR